MGAGFPQPCPNFTPESCRVWNHTESNKTPRKPCLFPDDVIHNWRKYQSCVVFLSVPNKIRLFCCLSLYNIVPLSPTIHTQTFRRRGHGAIWHGPSKSGTWPRVSYQYPPLNHLFSIPISHWTISLRTVILVADAIACAWRGDCCVAVNSCYFCRRRWWRWLSLCWYYCWCCPVCFLWHFRFVHLQYSSSFVVTKRHNGIRETSLLTFYQNFVFVLDVILDVDSTAACESYQDDRKIIISTHRSRAIDRGDGIRQPKESTWDGECFRQSDI